MRIISIFIFLLLITNLYSQDSYPDGFSGVIEANGFRGYIQSGILNDTVLSSPPQRPSSNIFSENNINILLKPNKNISLGIQKSSDRFQNSVELNYTLSPNSELYSINIYSIDTPEENAIINHALYFKRSGIITFGGLLTTSFSEIEAMGYKSMGFFKYNFININILNLFERRESYISPNNILQDDGWKIKNYITLIHSGYFQTVFNLHYKDEESYSLQESSLKELLTIPYNIVSLKGCLKERNENDNKTQEYYLQFKLKTGSDYLSHTVVFTPKYINAFFYLGSNSIEIKPVDNLKFEINYKWELVESYSHKVSSKLTFNGKLWDFNIIYTQPITEGVENWSIYAYID